MDDEAADTLMGLLPPSGWSWADVATKSYMAEKLSVLEQRIDAKLEALEARVDAKLEAFQAFMVEKFDRHRAETRRDLAEMEQRLEHRIDRQTWRFSFLVVLVAVGQSAAPHLLSRL